MGKTEITQLQRVSECVQDKIPIMLLYMGIEVIFVSLAFKQAKGKT